jgi:hypothetical protein
MKPYTLEIDIDLPREKVVELFDNPDNMRHWQNGFQSFEHISGEPGQRGAISKIHYINGKHSIELTEEITVNDLPDEFSGSYSWDSGSNTLVNRFIELDSNKTRWVSTCSYTMHSWMMKLMALFFSGKFKEQNLMFMKNFKAFAEDGKSVADEKTVSI